MINIQYENYLRHIMAKGVYKEDRTGTGTYSVFGHQMRFDLREGFPLITTKKVHMKSIVHELIWFLAGSTNIKYLQENGVKIWDEWADENGDLGPVYGAQWRSWPGRMYAASEANNQKDKTVIDGTDWADYSVFQEPIDQIQQAVDLLKNNPDSRRIIVSAWNPAEVPDMKLPPCHAFFQFYTEEIPLRARIAMLTDEEVSKYTVEGQPATRETLATTCNAHYMLNPVAHMPHKPSVPSRYLSCQLYQRSH